MYLKRRRMEGFGMETTYLNIDASYVTTCGMLEEQASGGSRVCYTRVPRRSLPRTAGGEKVIDLQAYRRRMEQADAVCADGEETEGAEEVRPLSPAPMTRRERMGLVMDLLSSAAVACCAVGVLLAFL
ncbi:MAG: hypothetical protein SOY13_08720 [Pseudoflavonifractor sp.]|nr:hypothetical protein [Pseudoflavonifractor sp.]